MRNPIPVFQVSVAPVGSAAVIAIAGELDLATAPRLLEVARSDEAGGDPVVLDMAQVTFVDSSGVRALLDVEEIVGHRGGAMAIWRPAPAVTRLLELVDLRSRFTEVDDVESGTLEGLSRS